MEEASKPIFDCLIDSIVTSAHTHMNYVAKLNHNSMAGSSILEIVETLKEMVKIQGILESLNEQLTTVLRELDNLPEFSPNILYTHYELTTGRLKTFNDQIVKGINFLDGKIRCMQVNLDELTIKYDKIQQNSDDKQSNSSQKTIPEENVEPSETNSSNDMNLNENEKPTDGNKNFDAKSESYITTSEHLNNWEYMATVDLPPKAKVQKEEISVNDNLFPTEINEPEEASSPLTNDSLYQSLIYEQFEKLFNIPAVGNNSKYLETLVQQLDEIIYSLIDLKADTKHLLIEVVIRSKLPWKAVDWIYFEGRNGNDWSVEKMLSLIHDYVEIEEKEFRIKNAIRSPQPKKECIFCGNNSHSNYQCFIYPTVSKRRARLQELNKCECCLKPAHRRCGWKCQLCLQNHHRVICPLQENQPESQQETHHQPETQPSLSQVLKSDLDTNWRN